MTMRLYEVIPIDSSQMATLMGSYYVNCCPYGHQTFLSALQGEEWEVQHNFTSLCLEWFTQLSVAELYDERNEDAVLLARKIASVVDLELLVHQKSSTKDYPEFMTINYVNGTSVEKAMAAYLNLAVDSYQPFLQVMLNEHRTLQQNFSRLCGEWLVSVENNPKMTQSSLFYTANQAAAFCTGLRYV